MTTGLVAGRGTMSLEVATKKEMHVKCIVAWNAWRTGDITSLRYYADKPIPKVK